MGAVGSDPAPPLGLLDLLQELFWLYSPFPYIRPYIRSLHRRISLYTALHAKYEDSEDDTSV